MSKLSQTARYGFAMALGTSALLAALCGCSTTSGPTPTESPTRAEETICQTTQLTLAKAGEENGAGNFSILYGLQNSSQQTCTLEGYPKVELLDANERPITTVVKQQTSAYLFNTQNPQPVTLNPGASGYFMLEWSAGPTSCPGAAFILVTPPGDRGSLRTAGNLEVCTGNVIVSPIEPAPFS